MGLSISPAWLTGQVEEGSQWAAGGVTSSDSGYLKKATRVSTDLLAFRAVPQLCSSSAATFSSSVLFESLTVPLDGYRFLSIREFHRF